MKWINKIIGQLSCFFGMHTTKNPLHGDYWEPETEICDRCGKEYKHWDKFPFSP